jgi:hypothetical protein
MRSMIPWGRLLAVLALLQGCAATGPEGIDRAGRLNEVPPGYGRIVFYRSDSILGAAIQPDTRLDGQVVGQSRPGGFFYVDASPGKHTASASTETTSTLDIAVVAGQTHYVRSAIGFGIAVGRVTLCVESVFTAKGELMGLSYSGSHVPRVGNAGALNAGSAVAAPTVQTQALPLKRGDEVVYRVVDGYTNTPRDAVYTVDRVDRDRIIFNHGGRIESVKGTVESIATPAAGEMDACSPPGGWGPPAEMTLGMRWSLRFRKPGGEDTCGGDYDLEAQMVSDEVMPTALGDYKVQRIDYKGSGTRQGIPITLEAKAWYSPVPGRVVKFESERLMRTGRSASPTREKAELVEIRRY